MFHERINPDYKGVRKMRDIIIFTDQPIRFEDCRAEISNNIKDVETNEKNSFWSTNKHHWNFSIDNNGFFDGASDEEHIHELKEQQKKIPITNPIVNIISAHRSIDFKRLIKILIALYPELYINIDDSTDWYGTAQEYLDTEFDY